MHKKIPILVSALACLVLPMKATTAFASHSDLVSSPLPLVLPTITLDFNAGLCVVSGVSGSCSGALGATSMTVSVAGVGNVVFSSSGQFSVTSGSTVQMTSGSTMNVTLPVIVLAFGSNLSSPSTPLLTVNVVGDAPPISNGTAPFFNPFYFGAGSATSFSTISYTVANGQLVIGNFEIAIAGGSASQAPEVLSIAMIGTGLIAFGGLKRLRRRREPQLQTA